MHYTATTRPVNVPAPSHVLGAVASPAAMTTMQMNGGPATLLQWIERKMPYAFDQLADRYPEMVASLRFDNPAKASDTRGKLFAGMGQESGGAVDPNYLLPEAKPQTDWGSIISSVVGGLTTSYTAKQLLDLNIKRAEQGLPPIDSSAVAPQLNVGVSKDVKTMALIGLGAVTLLALAVVFSKRRK